MVLRRATRSYNLGMADDIDTRLADWESRLDRLDGNDENVAPSEANGNHLLFVPAPSGYRLVERTGSAPAAGDVLELDEGEGRYVVSRVIRSPLPGDTRPCAYVALI
jgi:hypothetical protein